MIENVEAFLFDMDGVLVDNCRYHVLSWLKFAERHGGRITEREILDWMGAPGRDYIARMFDREVAPAQVERLLAEKEALYRELFRAHLQPRDGLLELLAVAKRRGIGCAVVTGGSRDNVDFVLDGLGIREYFACIVDSSRYRRGKPAPDCYLEAARQLGVKPEACVVFEDALNGIAAAQAAGMRVVAITGTNPAKVLAAARPWRVVDSFAELPDLA